jgi:hypothetical protein
VGKLAGDKTEMVINKTVGTDSNLDYILHIYLAINLDLFQFAAGIGEELALPFISLEKVNYDRGIQEVTECCFNLKFSKDQLHFEEQYYKCLHCCLEFNIVQSA